MFYSLEAPYLTPNPEHLVAQPWQIIVDDEPSDLPDFISTWAQGTDIRLHRAVEIDIEKLRSETHISAETGLAIVVTWMSDATKIRRCVFRSPVGPEPMNVSITLNGDEIGGRITLQTSLIINNSSIPGLPWIAYEVGSVLLTEKVQITLEGEGAAFPMAVVDFARTSYPPFASWHLIVSDELEARFSSTFQLMINEADKRLVKAVEAVKPTKEQRVLLEAMMGGAIAGILEFAYGLRSRGHLILDGHEEGTVGDVLANFILRTREQAIDTSSEPTEFSYQRSFFESMARFIGAGRSFE